MSEYQTARSERIRGHPGVWATKQADGTWTIYTVSGIYKVGVAYDKVRKILGQVRIQPREKK